MNRFFAAAACLAWQAAGGETVWPGGGVAVEAGRGAAVETGGGCVFVTSTESGPGVWPAAYFVFPAPRDLSGTAEVRVTFTNCCDEALHLSAKVKADVEQGLQPTGGVTVEAHARHEYRLRLQFDDWVFDKPHGLVGLKRAPLVGSGSSYSLEKTRSVAAIMPAGAAVGSKFGVLRVELVPAAAVGEPQGRRVLQADSFRPWVDAFGQANFAEWPDKIHSVRELRRKAAEEDAALRARPQGIPEADRFGGWAGGPQLEATGRFRTEKVDGTWWLVDPDGHLFFSHGVDHVGIGRATPVRDREDYFESLPPATGPARQFWNVMTAPALYGYYASPAKVPSPTFDFGAFNLYRKYGEDWKARNAETVHRRMRAWGLNTMAESVLSYVEAGTSRVPYTVMAYVDGRRIETAHAHWGGLVDPFSPEFAESVAAAAESLRKHADDPWCIGFFSGNEQSWDVSETGLARKILEAPDDQPAKVEFLRRLAAKGIDPSAGPVPDAELRAFGAAVADKYYADVRAAAKAVAPDMLFLGDRLNWDCPDVVRAAARHCDVVSMNVYDFHPDRDLPPGADDKPILITEFNFGCFEPGYFYASLVPVKNQAERAEAYRGYLRAVLDNPRYVGAHWFCWQDYPVTGHLGEGTNAQCGLVRMTDVPYAELVEAIRETAAGMYPRHAGAGGPAPGDGAGREP